MKKKKVQDNNGGLNSIFIVLLGVLMVFPPFFGGLFLDKYWLPYQVILGVLAMLFIVSRKKSNDISNRPFLDLVILTFIISYIISLLGAVNVPGALGETMKVASYGIVFLIVSRIAISERDILNILKTFYWAGICVTFISIGVAFGSLNIYGVFVNGRIYSTLQYPNTFAAYLTSLIIIGLHFLWRERNKYWRLSYSLGNFLLMYGFFGAKSRGGLLIFVMILVLYFIAIPSKDKVRAILKIIFQMVVAYGFSITVFFPVMKHSPLFYWGVLILASLISIVPNLLPLIVKREWTLSAKSKKMSIYISAVILAALLFTTVIVFLNVTGVGLFKNRLVNLSLSNSTAQLRLEFYKDAIEIVKDHPVLGAGGNGWKALYHQYQSFNYSSNQVHNHFLQVWVEAGLLGLAAFLSIWAGLFLTTLSAIKATDIEENKHLLWAVLMATLVLGVHALIDFDLSVPAIAILLFAFIGCLIAVQDMIGLKKYIFPFPMLINKIQRPVMLIVVVLFTALAIVLFTSFYYGEKGNGYLSDRSLDLAKGNLQKAVAINPFAAQYMASLSQVHMMEDNGNKDLNLEKALDKIKRAIKLEPNNPDYRLIYGNLLLLTGDIDSAIKEFEHGEKLGPYQQRYVDRLGEIYYLAGEYYFKLGENEKARFYLISATNYPEKVLKRIGLADSTYKKKQTKPLTVSPTLKSAQQKANDLLIILK